MKSMINNFRANGDTAKSRILIVGGGAGGASCAARARRLSEEAEIIVFEQGPHISYANCGLPYYVGDVITEEDKLIVVTPDLFRIRFNIDIRLHSDVERIDREKNEIEVKNLETGEIYLEKYDALVLSPGSSPIRPPLPGIDLPGILTLRTIPDSREIREWIGKKKVKRAVVIGGGFIGLEMTENLVKRGISTTIIEMLPQVMPPLDSEMAKPIQDYLVSNGVSLQLGDAVSEFRQDSKGGKITVVTRSNREYPCDIVILAIGVRPEVSLAREAGLDIGTLGGITTDDKMRTSDRQIWAVGDAVEVTDFVTGEQTLLPLAGPANRQGRIAADTIFGRDHNFRGVCGTAVCKVFDMTVASTGAGEKKLKSLAGAGNLIQYEKLYMHRPNHTEVYPGAETMSIKLLFSTDDGRILGAQAVGKEGVEKRIDVIAMAIQQGASIYDLEEAELCYAPQFSSAKDPVNIAGMIAANVLRGDTRLAHWPDIDISQSTLLDVRDLDEFEDGHVEGVIHIPLDELRQRISELSRDGEILTYCAVGQRAYYASRILSLNGFKIRNISGGFTSYEAQKSESP